MQVWHSDPLICPQCEHPRRVIAVIDQRAVVEKILRHVGQWSGTPPMAPAPLATPCREWAVDPRADESQSPSLKFSLQLSAFSSAPMPDYENVLTD